MTTESTPGALGSNDQLGAGDARYCYSPDEENYFGDFATREDALDNARLFREQCREILRKATGGAPEHA